MEQSNAPMNSKMPNKSLHSDGYDAAWLKRYKHYIYDVPHEAQIFGIENE